MTYRDSGSDQPFGDPLRFLEHSTKDKDDDQFELDYNFAKKTSWNPLGDAIKEKEDLLERRQRARKNQAEQFTSLYSGDPNQPLAQFLPQLQTNAPHGEKALFEAKQQATRMIEAQGHLLDDAALGELYYIAEHGMRKTGFQAAKIFSTFFDILDTVPELIRTVIADVSGADTKSGEEITFMDYVDGFFSNQEGIIARHSEDFVEDFGLRSNFGFEGRLIGRQFEGEESYDAVMDADGVSMGKIGRFAGGFLFDVLTDPLTYLTFGTAGIGRRAAMEAVTAVAVGTTKGARGWKGAAQHLLRGGKLDDLDGVARHAAEQIEKRVLRESDEVATQLRRTYEAEGLRKTDMALMPKERAALDSAARESIIRQELNAIQVVEGTKLGKVSELLERLGKKDDLRFGTAFESDVSEMARLVASKKNKEFFEKFGVYAADEAMPQWAMGGLKLALPFYRRSMPMVNLGLRADGPGQKLMTRALDAMPDYTSDWLRTAGMKFSPSRQVLTGAKRYNAQMGENVSPYFARKVADGHLKSVGIGIDLSRSVDQTHVAMALIHDLGESIPSLGKKGAEDLVRQVLGGNMAALKGAKLTSAQSKQIIDQAAGIRGTLDTIHAAANEVGSKIGMVEDYVPLVASPAYTKELSRLGRSEIGIVFDGITDPELRLGLEILSEYAASSQGARTAVRRLGDSEHARSRIATANFQGKAGGLSDTILLDRDSLKDILAANNLSYFDHDALNRAVKRGLDHLADQGKIDKRIINKIGDTPFETDLAVVLDNYVTSMSSMIKMQDAANIYRKAGLLVPEAEKISVTRTLSMVEDGINSGDHPIMRLLDDVAGATERGGAAAVAEAASKMVDVEIVKGWTMRVPAAIVDTKPFNRIRDKLSRAYRQVDDNLRTSEAAVLEHKNKLIAAGTPDEIATRIALVESNSEFATIMEEMRKVADQQATELVVLGEEQILRNAHKISDEVAREQLDVVYKEADKIRRGVQNTIADHETQLAAKMKVKVRDADVDEWVDLSGARAPDGSERSFYEFMADKGDEFMGDKDKWHVLEDMSPNQLEEIFEHPEIAHRAGQHLISNLDGVELTVADLVKFSDPSKAARTLEVLAGRMDQAGLDTAVLMSDDLRVAVTNLDASLDHLADVRNGFSEGTIKAAKLDVVEARLALVEQAEELVTNTTLLSPQVSYLADDFSDILIDPLFSFEFTDVWAAALHKIPNQSKGEFAASMRAQGVRSIGQKEMYGNGSKAAMRDAGARQLAGWHGAVAAGLDARGVTTIGDMSEHAITKAIRALRSGDSAALVNYEKEIQFLMDQIMPTLEGTIHVRPSGAVGFQHVTEKSVWVTLDDVVPTLRKIVPNGDDMSLPELVGTALEAHRAAPEAMEGASKDLQAWFRAVDSNGGLDFDLASYEYLENFSAELATTQAKSLRDVAQLGKPARVTAAATRRLKASEALNTVMDNVNTANRGKGVGEKTLERVWEQNIGALRAGAPREIIDRARALVDYTIGIRHTNLPKSVLNKQMAIRRHLWEPLEEGIASFDSQVDDLIESAVAAGNVELARAAEGMRHFQERLINLNTWGDDLDPVMREGRVGLVDTKGEFATAFEEMKTSGFKAIEDVKKLDRADQQFLMGIDLPTDGTQQSLEAYLKRAQRKIADWEPQTVDVKIKDGFVDLEYHGVAGSAFGGQLADPVIAHVLENMVGHLAVVNSPAGVKALVDNVRGWEKWWRAGATVARPTFVPRNIMGGIFNGMIIGVGVKHYEFAARHIMPAVRSVRNNSKTIEQVIAEASPKARGYLAGIFESEVLSSSFAASNLDHFVEGVSVGTKLNPLSAQNYLFRGGGKVMETSEDFLRSAAFIANYNPKAPATAFSAKAMTMAVHFDYTELTSTERFIKKLAPFFTWTRNNVPLQIRTMIEKPGLYTRYRHFTSNLEGAFGDPDKTHATNQYRSALAADISDIFSIEGDEFWSKAVFDPDLPWRDIEELMGGIEGGIPGVLDWALGSLSPVVKTPMDMATSSSYDVVAPSPLAEIISLFGGGKEAVDGSIMIGNKQKAIAQTLVPFAQEIQDVMGIVPNDPRQAARLGYETTQPIPGADRGRAILIRLLRAGGLSFDTPHDSLVAAQSAQFDTMAGIREDAAITGQAVPVDLQQDLLDFLEKKQWGE